MSKPRGAAPDAVEMMDLFIDGMKELNERFLSPQDAKMYERKMTELRERIIGMAAKGGEAGGSAADNGNNAQ